MTPPRSILSTVVAGAVGALVAAPICLVAAPTLVTFTNGSLADAPDVNANFSALAAAVDDVAILQTRVYSDYTRRTTANGGYYYFGPVSASEYANLVERLSGGTYLVVNGTAVTTNSRAGLSGNLIGGVAHHDSRFPNIALLSSMTGVCGSDAHRFALTRQ